MLGRPFDPQADTDIYEHCRPHWSQAGTVVFITFRTVDSIPSGVARLWDRQKRAWLAQRGQHGGEVSELLTKLNITEQAAFRKQFERCREDYLDTCHGQCLLKDPELASIVGSSLLHFDRQRYRMGDFVVMPNHVHLLAVFPTADALRIQCDSWMHYTAFKINQATGGEGKFWQQEPFDHLVRSGEQYAYLRRYIADNPAKAHLRPGESLYHRFED